MNGSPDTCKDCKWFISLAKEVNGFDGTCGSRKHNSGHTFYVHGGSFLCFDGDIPHRQCSCGGDPVIKKDWRTSSRFGKEDDFIECPRCGKRTKNYSMPWLAWQAWDKAEVDQEQMSIFDLMEE